MSRIRHGDIVPIEHSTAAPQAVSPLNESLDLTMALEAHRNLHRFDFLFFGLQEDPENLLPEDEKTLQNLKLLGQNMMGAGEGAEFDSNIPAIYVYFGQFIDHDITLEKPIGSTPDLSSSDLRPLALSQIRNQIKNARTAYLDLDSVYNRPAPPHDPEMVIGKVTSIIEIFPESRQGDPFRDFNDLPRRNQSKNSKLDRAALIGDPRNDENLIIAQLHVAFLRAHNAIARQVGDFNKARKLLRQHYQWIVIEEFLKRIADPAIVQQVRDSTSPIFNPTADGPFIPLEFSAAAYRFGHSMIRPTYFYSSLFDQASLGQLFSFTRFSGLLGNKDIPHLPSNWIIEWQYFLDGSDLKNKARRITTSLIEPLFGLLDKDSKPLPGEARLAVRNLLRGYLLRLPTGQAVARELKIQALSPEQIDSVAANPEQRQVLRDSGFLARTPLWFYILAEAAYYQREQNHDHLGPVGSTLVAEVLIGLVRRSPHSILASPGWKPTLNPASDQFTLPDLLKLAGVLSSK